jgi:opacity protein-like surface antigen
MSFRTTSTSFRVLAPAGRFALIGVHPRLRMLALTLLLGIAAPGAAQADGLLIPFLGVNFGGNSGKELSDAVDAKRFNWGVSLAYMGGGVLGLEADIARSPDFYGKTDVGGSSVFTATGNILLGVPIGGQRGVGIRPYALAGIGVIRSKVDAFGEVFSLDDSKAAWDFGGGAMFFLGTHVGIRADVRYFRTFGDVTIDPFQGSNTLDFTRASAGLILRF